MAKGYRTRNDYQYDMTTMIHCKKCRKVFKYSGNVPVCPKCGNKMFEKTKEITE